MDKIIVGLFDGTFKGAASNYGDENEGLTPKHIEWVRDWCTSPTTVFTDMYIPHIQDYPVKKEDRRIAWLLEPMGFSDTAYKAALELESNFDYIISHDRWFLTKVPLHKAIWCPVGGLWVNTQRSTEPNIPAFPGATSFILARKDKNRTPGHILRRQIATYFEGELDFFGEEAGNLEHKSDAFEGYQYSVVVESCRADGYFTEKIVDCLAYGVIPIYWGAPDIDHYFDPRGIIPFSDFFQLKEILNNLKQVNGAVIQNNRLLAARYYCAEDWLYTNYWWLFR